MNHQLSRLLSRVPNEVFFDYKGDPNFNAIFVEVARAEYGQSGENFSIPVRDFLKGKLPNLSSFQRAVARERMKRERSFRLKPI